MKLKIPSPKRLVCGVFPILQWSRTYDASSAVGDLIAGITIALTLVPQSIAYASLAGFEPQYGLYSSFMGPFVYAIMGFLVEFISVPVVSGFTSAAALTIASSQVKGLLGLRYNADTFVSTWKNFFKHVGEARLSDSMLSLGCIIVLTVMKAMKDIKIKDKAADEKGCRKAKILKKVLWVGGVSRNAVVVCLASLIAYFVYEDKYNPFLLTAKGKTVDATQEIVALGVCNIVSAFFQSIPVNGSFSRSAVSDASGVKTPGSGIYTGIIVILTLVLLTPYFYFIPRAALSSVIVCAVLQMVNYEIIKKLWRSSRLDLIPLFGTFLCCLFLGVEIGLVCGVGIDALLLLYYHSRPPLDVQYVDDGVLPPHYAIRPVGGLHFAGAERVRQKLFTLQQHKPRAIPVTTVHISNGIDSEVSRNNQRNVPTMNGASSNGASVIKRNDVEASGVKTTELLVIY
ncbi:hypothetical protein HF086_008042, partial [Spodoptera exigua]